MVNGRNSQRGTNSSHFGNGSKSFFIIDAILLEERLEQADELYTYLDYHRISA